MVSCLFKHEVEKKCKHSDQTKVRIVGVLIINKFLTKNQDLKIKIFLKIVFQICVFWFWFSLPLGWCLEFGYNSDWVCGDATAKPWNASHESFDEDHEIGPTNSDE